MKSSKFYLVLVLIVISLFIGVLVGKMYNVPVLTIDTNINPLHALSMIITVFIAIVITIYFDHEKEKNKVVKEIIIKRIDNAISIVETLFDAVSAGKIKSEVIPGYPKRIHSSLKCSWSSFSDNKIETSISFSELELVIRELKKLLTDTPLNNNGVDGAAPIKAENGCFIYSEARVSEVSVELEKLKNKLFKAQLDVNMS